MSDFIICLASYPISTTEHPHGHHPFIVFGLITGLLASRKGYNFILWFFAAGILGLIILACLPYANLPEQSISKQEELQRKGNQFAIVIDIFAAIAVIFVIFCAPRF